MTTSPGSRPESDIDFTDVDVNRNPFPYLEEIRSLGAAVWNPPSDSWLITSYDDVKSVFFRPDDFAQDVAMFEAINGGPTITSLDNPRHNELRRVFMPYFSRPAMESQQDRVRDVVSERLDPIIERLRAGETVDMAPYFRAIPTEVISRVMGVPKEDGHRFIDWNRRMTGVYEIVNSPGMENAEEVKRSAASATEEMYAYCAAAFAERLSNPNADNTDLIGALAENDVLTEREKIAHITMLIFGGQDTTETLAKNTAAAFALHPDQRLAVAQDRTLMRQALEEVMRWRPPVFSEVRIVRGPGVEMGGISLGQGDNVSPVIGAAHRDPVRWENPEVFDIFRPEMGHLGFGFGVHNCLGVNLARLEVQTIFDKLLDEVPEYQLALSDEELDYGTFFSIRGPKTLPLSL